MSARAGQPGHSAAHTSLADLHAYADQAMDAPRAAQIEAHMRSCGACQQEWKQVMAQRQHVAESWLASSPPPSAIPDKATQLQRLHARRAAQQPAQTLPAERTGWLSSLPWQSWSLWAAPLAAACFLVFAWAGQPWLTPGETGTQEPTTTPPTTSRHTSSAQTPHRPSSPAQASPNPNQTPSAQPLHLRAKGLRLRMQILYAPPATGAATNQPTRVPVQAVTQGARLQPGGLIQFRFHLGAPRHVMIVGINQRGEVFPYLPFRGTQSLSLQAGRMTRPTASSLELDDTLGAERFVLATSSKSFSFADLQRAIKDWWRLQQRDVRKPLQLPLPWSSRSLLVFKHKSAPHPTRPPTRPQQRPGTR